MYKPPRDANNGCSSLGGGGAAAPAGFQLAGLSHAHHTPPHLPNGPSSAHAGRMAPYPSRECLAPLSFNTPTHHGSGLQKTLPVHYQQPALPPRTLREEFAKNNRTIEVHGRKFENIVEKDFRKLSELGHGSFGQVDKMLHVPSKVEFAVKVSPPSHTPLLTPLVHSLTD